LYAARTNFTLVLVNGVRVNDPPMPAVVFDFSDSTSPTEAAWRSRGTYSAVYGGDALAGVVNIVTRHGREQKPRASLDAAGCHEFSLSAGGPMAEGAWNLGASDSNEGEVVRGNHFESQRVSGNIDTALGAATNLTLSGRYSDSQRAGFPDDSGGYEFAEIRDTEKRQAHESVFGAGLSTRAGNAASRWRWVTSIAAITSIHPASHPVCAILLACRRAWSTQVSRGTPRP
jgi:hypothetical protein